MAWHEAIRATDFAPDNGGIIILWHTPNIADGTPWRTSGIYGEDIYYYFIIPAGFVHTGEDEFTFNFGLEYVNEQVEVNGFVSHSGTRPLQEGLTVPFWHLKQSAPSKVTMQTDNKCKLPYLQVPSRGLPSFLPEVRYFIPLPEVA